MNKTYIMQVENILRSPEIGLFGKKYDFNGARRAVFNSPSLARLMEQNGVPRPVEISSGVSDEKAYAPYLRQAAQDLLESRYYRSYYANRGDTGSREALAFMENAKFGSDIWQADDFAFTEGSTGAISAFIEYFSKAFPGKKAVITNPCYYLYRSSCNYYGVPYREVDLFSREKEGRPSFISPGKIIGAIDSGTGLVIINNPFNPSGETYDRRGLGRIIRAAKRQGAIVMIDELFQDLVYDPRSFVPADVVARKNGALENVVIIKGYSKNKNLVALRLGYLFSKNKAVLEGIGRINQVRQSFPSASNYAGLIQLDAFVQAARSGIGKGIAAVKRAFPENTAPKMMDDAKLKRIVDGYGAYSERLLRKYSDAYDLSVKSLGRAAAFIMPKVSAFNTFARIPELDRINQFDFTLNLYVNTGVKIEIGPCFGFSQKDWENDPGKGFWLRITFAKNRKDLKEGIARFIRFKDDYLKRKSRYLDTGLSF